MRFLTKMVELIRGGGGGGGGGLNFFCKSLTSCSLIKMSAPSLGNKAINENN